MNWNERYSMSQGKPRTIEQGYLAPVIRDNCGTKPGYEKHIRSNEVACDACKDFMAVHMRLKKLKFEQVTQNPEDLTVPQQFKQRIEVAEKPVKRRGLTEDILNPDDPKHGTHSGYAAHLAINDQPCRACTDAMLQYKKEYRKRNLEKVTQWESEAGARYRAKPETKEKIKKWRQTEKAKAKSRQNSLEYYRKVKDDPEFKEKRRIRERARRERLKAEKQKNQESS